MSPVKGPLIELTVTVAHVGRGRAGDSKLKSWLSSLNYCNWTSA